MNGGAIAWDYVIVGSGAGGGTLAARLVESGKRVFVIEAGSDGPSESGARLPADYEVPGFHAFACENDAIKWDYAVQHYSKPAQQRRDWKYSGDLGGILYPRAATLGGCTAHNAMIYMLPHDADWDAMADHTGDASWSARRMRKYSRRLESCQYRPLWRRLQQLRIDPTGHGWSGWLHTETPEVLEALDDGQLLQFIGETARAFLKETRHPLRTLPQWLLRLGDPNSRQGGSGPFEGLCNVPLTSANHVRLGARERLLQAQARHPDRLHIEINALATQVLFAPDGSASGVEYLKGKALYRRSAFGERCAVRARSEVILSAGAFNTPQLLMLSGIGPEAQLVEHDIKVRVPLTGVGKNLQDRYEVAVTHRMGHQWSLLREAHFERGDALWREWVERRKGLYSSNGAALAFVMRSEGEPLPDIFCMGLPVRFEGYFPGFSRALLDNRNCLTWAVLKAHTRNRAGEVTLRSRDVRVPPQVNFKYFDEGSDSEGRDLKHVVQAIQFVRRLTAPLIRSGLIAEECVPGPEVDSPERLAEYVRDTAWGHHASCSCAMGPRERGGVIDSRFKVHGVERLRIVDASVFPRIPGFFIASAVYLIAEKAADAILESAPALASASSDSLQQHEEINMTTTVSDLLRMSQQQLDDLFRSVPAGDIPNGPADGTAIIAPDTPFSQPIASMINLFGWQGKVFDAQKGLLKNRILAMGIEAIVARVYKAPSWLDGKECIVLDYSDTSIVAQWIRDEIRLIQPNFYLGKVYWAKDRLIDFCLQFNT